MDLSKKCKDYWGLQPFKTPFGDHIEDERGLYLWPDLQATIERIASAIEERKYLLVAGPACSAKTTAWSLARASVMSQYPAARFCSPAGLSPDRYDDKCIYSSVKSAFDGMGGAEVRLAGSVEGRARQCRRLLEEANARKEPVCMVVNDAHECKGAFLLCLKRMWDDLHGFDRLVSIILIGQPAMLALIAGRPEISKRADICRMPSLEDHLGDYVNHEWSRCALKDGAAPFDDSALDELGKLATPNWLTTRDHPLEVNNVVSRALYKAWRMKVQQITRDVIVEATRTEE